MKQALPSILFHLSSMINVTSFQTTWECEIFVNVATSSTIKFCERDCNKIHLYNLLINRQYCVETANLNQLDALHLGHDWLTLHLQTVHSSWFHSSPFLLLPQLRQTGQQAPSTVMGCLHTPSEGQLLVPHVTVPSLHWHWSHGLDLERNIAPFLYCSFSKVQPAPNRRK